MATKQPCPRCGWPTKFAMQVRRTDGETRLVCLPCVLEVAEGQFAKREQWLADNNAMGDRLQGEEAD